MANDLTPAHLGGHHNLTHVDDAVFSYLCTRFPIASMLDVGCGPGGMVDLAIQRGIRAVGIDGDPALRDRRIVCHDYTRGPLPWTPVDLVWSVEFVEHVEPIYIGNFLETFAAGRVLFFTHALPGQPGHHHVNCQPSSYWAKLLVDRGWSEDTEATAWVQTHGTDPYTKATGMVWTH